jgi:hypothetical protein
MIGFIGTSSQLQSIMTAHNQWLSKTRSIPCWTTGVCSSTVINDERRITAHTLNCLERRLSDELFLRMNYDSFITSRRPVGHHIEQLIVRPLSWKYLCLATCYLTTTCSLLFVAERKWFPSRCPTMDYSFTILTTIFHLYFKQKAFLKPRLHGNFYSIAQDGVRRGSLC